MSLLTSNLNRDVHIHLHGIEAMMYFFSRVAALFADTIFTNTKFLINTIFVTAISQNYHRHQTMNATKGNTLRARNGEQQSLFSSIGMWLSSGGTAGPSSALWGCIGRRWQCRNIIWHLAEVVDCCWHKRHLHELPHRPLHLHELRHRPQHGVEIHSEVMHHRH